MCSPPAGVQLTSEQGEPWQCLCWNVTADQIGWDGLEYLLPDSVTPDTMQDYPGRGDMGRQKVSEGCTGLCCNIPKEKGIVAGHN